MATISYNKTLNNYVVPFATGSTVTCHNYRTAVFYQNRGC